MVGMDVSCKGGTESLSLPVTTAGRANALATVCSLQMLNEQSCTPFRRQHVCGALRSIL